jgi:ribonuclease BN (tRNA processing enzyme)
VFITHHHVDHNADLGYLLVAPWTLKGHHRAPVVLGPPGTFEYTRRVLAAQDFDLRVRRHHGYVPATAAPAVVELNDG